MPIARMPNPVADKAKELLSHYFDQAGVVTHNDNVVEINTIVDYIIDAAVLETLAEIAARAAMSSAQ